MLNRQNEFPQGLKEGDFIQTQDHVGDVFFEVEHVMPPRDGSTYWQITFTKFDKYGSHPRSDFVNCASGIRRVVPAELAVPGFIAKRQRFHSRDGQYDPFYGFAPVGTPMRQREATRQAA